MLKNDKFKEARKAAGFTQKEFAEKFGSNQAYVSALETRSNFSLDTAIELGNILGIDGKTLMVDESGEHIKVNKEAIVNNVLGFLKKKNIKITELIEKLNISRTAFYYQIKNENMKQSFKNDFEKVTGFNIMAIINEKI
jgi:transcriptional regulator with XRE-family HTH domain